jgi:cell division protein FtsI/penicillin-binding protein 2
LLPAALAGSLHDQSLAALLERQFPDPLVEYLLLDTASRTAIASHWTGVEAAAPMGSLMKPFAALAWAQGHDSPYPVFECRGTVNGCWSARAHGRLNIEDAVEQSCNAYFLALAAQIDADEMKRTSAAFGLTPPGKDTPSARIGLRGDWKVTPFTLALGYAELAERRSDPRVRPLLAGMALSAETGTGRAAGKPALAKTGTAPCAHARRQPGDGYTVLLFPADSPRYVLLVRVDGVPGSKAAATAGRMMRTVLIGK